MYPSVRSGGAGLHAQEKDIYLRVIFQRKSLEAAIKQTVRDFCVQPECVARRAQGPTPPEACPHGEMAFRDASCTKTYVYMKQ